LSTKPIAPWSILQQTELSVPQCSCHDNPAPQYTSYGVDHHRQQYVSCCSLRQGRRGDRQRIRLSAWRHLCHDLTKNSDVGNAELGDDYRQYID
ncbi:hypothetical protein R4P64_29915, partial [Rhodococcus sp. IEGM 1366]|uniref:hypothetical protein n=1 Tax=Rhodococcus sp. IEGM 1366 TaxID=3082223 RepID=UPI0029536A82